MLLGLSMSRRKTLLLMLPLVVGVYIASWVFSGTLGITHPMANGRYFYYGSNPESLSDWVFYQIYYSTYRIHLVFEDRMNEGRDFVHWSDRNNEAPTDED